MHPQTYKGKERERESKKERKKESKKERENTLKREKEKKREWEREGNALTNIFTKANFSIPSSQQ